MKNLAIIGSRHYPVDWLLDLFNTLGPWLQARQRAAPRDQLPPICIVSGDGGNVDVEARCMAYNHQLPYFILPPDWRYYDNAAGPIRNRHIAEVAHVAIAICRNPLKPSKGTADCLSRFATFGKPTMVFEHTQLELIKAFIETFT